ncbi:MAG TPA: DUF222 domain-containing protein [Nitriliruptorales bacterium]
MFDHDTPTNTAGPTSPSVLDAGARGVERRLARILEDARQLASGDLTGLSAATLNRMLATQRQVDAAVAAWRASLLAACDQSVLDSAGAVDKVGLVRARLGLSGHEAKKEASLAEGLAGLPETREALREGRIDPDHARRLASAVEEGSLGSGAQVEKTLLDAAERLDADRFGRHVRRRQQQARSAAEQLSREREAHRRRMLSTRDRGDGLTELRALLPTMGAAQFKNALAGFMTFDGDDVAEQDRRTWGQRAADGFLDMVQAAQSAPRDGSVGRARADVTVMIPWSVWSGGDGVAELEGQVVSAEVARQAACDANISRLLVGPASQPLDVGRSTRDWSVAQRRAIVARDGHCRFPACDRPAAWCQAHHIRWWKRDRGPTDVSNGILVCQRHHTAVHVGGWTVSLDATSGVATWTSPSGEQYLTQPEGALHTLMGAHHPSDGPVEDPVRRPAIARELPARYAAWPVDARRGVDDHPSVRMSDQLALAGTASRAP